MTLLQALQVLAKMRVLSDPARFPHVEVMCSPSTLDSFHDYTCAVLALADFASRGGFSPIRHRPARDTAAPLAFELFPDPATLNTEEALRAAVSSGAPVWRDRHGVPILSGSCIFIEPLEGATRTELRSVNAEGSLMVAGHSPRMVYTALRAEPAEGPEALTIIAAGRLAYVDASILSRVTVASSTRPGGARAQ